MTFNTLRSLFTKKNRLTKNKWFLVLLVVVIVIGVYLYSHKNKENFAGDTITATRHPTHVAKAAGDKILFEDQTLVEGLPVVLKNEGAFTDIARTTQERRQSLQYGALALDYEIFDGQNPPALPGGPIGKNRDEYEENQVVLNAKRNQWITLMESKPASFTYISNIKEHSLQLFLPRETDLNLEWSGDCTGVFDDKSGREVLIRNFNDAKTTLRILFPSLTIITYSCLREPSSSMKDAVDSTKNTSTHEIACLRSGLYIETEGLSFPLIQYRAVGTQHVPNAVSGICQTEAGAVSKKKSGLLACNKYITSVACNTLADSRCSWRTWYSPPLIDGVMTSNLTIEEDADNKFLIPTTNDIVDWVTNLLRGGALWKAQ